jgi:hypothetical protein
MVKKFMGRVGNTYSVTTTFIGEPCELSEPYFHRNTPILFISPKNQAFMNHSKNLKRFDRWPFLIGGKGGESKEESLLLNLWIFL